MKYALINGDMNIIRESEFDEKPDDPVGKGWKWIKITEIIPITGEDEKLGVLKTEITDKEVIHTRKIEEIATNRIDVNFIRDKKLQETYSLKLPNEGPIVTMRMDSGTITNLSNLVIHALILKTRGDHNRTTTYRDLDNTNHSLTPDQLCDLFVAVNLEVQSIYEAAWLIKDDETLPDTLKELKLDPRWP